MYLKNLSIYLIMIAFFTGCSKEDIGNPIAYEMIFEYDISYAEEEIIPQQYLIFKNELEWNNFLPEIERISPYGAENFTGLNFDFNQNILILIIGKYHYTCCSEITINGVYKRNENIVVKYKESGPGVFQAVSQAYVLISISK